MEKKELINSGKVKSVFTCKKCGKYTMDKTKVIRTLLEPSGLGIEDIEME